MVVTSGSDTITLSDYNAAYLNHEYVPAMLEIKNFWADKALTPLYFRTDWKHDTLKVQVMFKGAGLGDVSALGEKLKRCEIVIGHAFPGGMVFDCVLERAELKKISSKVRVATYSFNCLVFGETREFIASGNSLFIHGAKETEAVITIENKTASVIAAAGITGYTIRSLAAGEKVIIDGERKTVTANGADAFDRVEFFSFPRYGPGSNAISITGNADIRIKYRERW